MGPSGDPVASPLVRPSGVSSSPFSLPFLGGSVNPDSLSLSRLIPSLSLPSSSRAFHSLASTLLPLAVTSTVRVASLLVQRDDIVR